MEIVYVYTKKRADFGRQCHFTDRQITSKEMHIAPDEELTTHFIDKNPCYRATQNAPDMSEHEINTVRFERETRGMNHLEGGWPKDVNPSEVEQTIRYRKKVEKDERYIQTVVRLGELMEQCIKQNNSIDIYEEYFEGLSDVVLSNEPPSVRTISVFRDPNEADFKRNVSSICWHPDGAKKIAVAHAVLEFQRAPTSSCRNSYIWNLEKPNKPEFTLKSISPIVSLEYNPKDSHILVGGCYNGLIAFWDTRKGSQPVEMSSIDHSHHDPVYRVRFLASKSGSECFSTSTDGQVLWWDLRKISEPTDSLTMELNGRKFGGMSLDYEPTMPTKFMVGTDQRSVLLCNRKAKSANDRIFAVFSDHLGSVYGLQRNPFFPKVFLTVADWQTRIWSEDFREAPIMWTKHHKSYMLDGCWSPVRPAVFFTTQWDGTLNVWDFIFKQNEATLTVKVCDEPLAAVRVPDSGRYVAVGSQQGTVTILELSERLSQLQPNEKQSTSTIFDRQLHREKALEARNRELRIKERAKSSRLNETPGPDVTANVFSGTEDNQKLIAESARIFWDVIGQGRTEREERRQKRAEEEVPKKQEPVSVPDRIVEEAKVEEESGSAQQDDKPVEEHQTKEETGSGAQAKEETKVSEDSTLGQSAEEVKATEGNGSTTQQDEAMSNGAVGKQGDKSGGSESGVQQEERSQQIVEENSKVSEEIEAGAQQNEKVDQAVEKEKAGEESGSGVQQDTPGEAVEKKIDEEIGSSRVHQDEILERTVEESTVSEESGSGVQHDEMPDQTEDNKDYGSGDQQTRDGKGDSPTEDEQTGPTEPETQDTKTDEEVSSERTLPEQGEQV